MTRSAAARSFPRRPPRRLEAGRTAAPLCALLAGLVLLAAAALLRAEGDPDLKLRGDRFRPLTWAELDASQRSMAEHVLAGARGSLNGPYNVFLRSPEMGDLAQAFGAQTRFKSSVPEKLKEFAILLVARSWTSRYEWYAHRRIALERGLPEALIEDVAAGRPPRNMSAEEQAVYAFCRELLVEHEVSDSTFRNAVDRFGERGVVDLIGVMGYYHLVSMALNVDRYPLPPGASIDLPRLARPLP